MIGLGFAYLWWFLCLLGLGLITLIIVIMVAFVLIGSLVIGLDFNDFWLQIGSYMDLCCGVWWMLVVWVGNLLDFRLLFGCLGLVVDGERDCGFWVGYIAFDFWF